MMKISEMLVAIRATANLTQPELAEKLGVSAILISKLEVEQAPVSKGFIEKLANALDVHPASISPALFAGMKPDFEPSTIEKKLLQAGAKLQKMLIEKRAKALFSNK